MDWQPRGIDLEIFEIVKDGEGALGIIRPNCIRINGADCLTPQDSVVEVRGLLDGGLLTATVTLFVRSLKVHAE